MFTRRILILLLALLPLLETVVISWFLILSGCAAMVVGTVVGVATTVAIETAKVPFKVGGAAVDVMTDDDEDEDD